MYFVSLCARELVVVSSRWPERNETRPCSPPIPLGLGSADRRLLALVVQQPGAVRGLAVRHHRRDLLPLAVLLGRQMGDLDVDRLRLLELGRDEAKAVADLVAGQGHVLAFDVRNVHENVVASAGGLDEAMSFAPAERPHFPLLDGVTHGPVRCGSGPGAPGDDRRRKLQMGRARRNAGHRLWRRRNARRWLVVCRYLDVAGHDGYGAVAANTGQG